LDLDGNSLTSLPEDFTGLTNITYGHITNNCLVINQPSPLQNFLTNHGIFFNPQNASCGGEVRRDVCANITDLPANECNALVALYTGTNGNSWYNKTNWLT
jgi:hypothetical protein